MVLSGPSSVDEGGTATYAVSLSHAGVIPTADVTVEYATSDSTARSSDYAGVSGTLTFTSADAADKNVTVQTTQDSAVEGNESFSFALSNPSGGGATPTLGSPSSITTTIIDNDRRPSPPSNNSPRFDEGASANRSVVENAAVGTAVGDPVRARDSDRDRLEYWLWGPDLASFDVNPKTGQLTTKTALDYESKSEYSVHVSVRDGRGGIDGIVVAITVEDVDEPPGRPAAPEIALVGPTSLSVTWTAPDNNGPVITDYDVQYREEDGEFQDAGYDGDGVIMTLEDLKLGTLYEVQVRALNAEGIGPWSESDTGETEAAPTPTPEPTPGPTATPTPSPEPTPGSGESSGVVPTATPRRVATPAATVEPTPTPMSGSTSMPEPTSSAVATPVLGANATPTVPPSTRTPAPTAASTSSPEPTATPDPAYTDAPASGTETSDGDAGDGGGFPWWIIAVIVMGIVAGILFLIWARRQRMTAWRP